MKVSTENDNNFGCEKITILVDNIPLSIYSWKTIGKKQYGHCYVCMHHGSVWIHEFPKERCL